MKRYTVFYTNAPPAETMRRIGQSLGRLRGSEVESLPRRHRIKATVRVPVPRAVREAMAAAADCRDEGKRQDGGGGGGDGGGEAVGLTVQIFRVGEQLEPREGKGGEAHGRPHACRTRYAVQIMRRRGSIVRFQAVYEGIVSQVVDLFADPPSRS